MQLRRSDRAQSGFGARASLEAVQGAVASPAMVGVLWVVSSAVAAAVLWRFGVSWSSPGFVVWAVGLVVVSAVDLRWHRLPREILYGICVLGVPWLMVACLIAGEPYRVLLAWFGGCLGGGAMLVVFKVSHGGLGRGDVRLAAVIGVFVGWLNPGLVAVALALGFLAGAAAGAVLVVTRRADRSTVLPFGPFLAVGALATVIAGQPLLDALLHR